jgi:hypothetical protein
MVNPEFIEGLKKEIPCNLPAIAVAFDDCRRATYCPSAGRSFFAL